MAPATTGPVATDPGPSSSSRALAALPPVVWAALAGGAQLALARRSRRLGSPVSLPRAAPVAEGLALAAATLGGAAVVDFVRRSTTVNPHAPERTIALVTGGPLRWSRNPMYLALAGALTASAIASGTPMAMLPVAGFVLVMDRGQIRVEEAALQERFGASYTAYRARVRRWL